MPTESPVHEEHDKNTVVRWRTSDYVENFPVATTLPCNTKEERAWVLSAIEAPCQRGADLIGQEFVVGDYVIHPVVLTDEDTGEEKVVRRSVFLQPDGPPVSFCSDGVLKSLNKIAWQQGTPPPWEPPVRVRLNQRNTGRGRRSFYLTPVS